MTSEQIQIVLDEFLDKYFQEREIDKIKHVVVYTVKNAIVDIHLSGIPGYGTVEDAFTYFLELIQENMYEETKDFDVKDWESILEFGECSNDVHGVNIIEV